MQEPRALLAGSGFEDQCAKLNGHPGRALLLRGPATIEKLRAALGSGQVRYRYTSAAHKLLSREKAKDLLERGSLQRALGNDRDVSKTFPRAEKHPFYDFYDFVR